MAKSIELGSLARVLSVNTAANSVTVNSQIAVGNSTVHSTGFSIGNTSIHSTGVTIDGQSLNATSFAGTANNTNFVGSVAAANVVSNAQLQSNVTTIQTYADNKAANAYSNSVSYTDAKIETANAAITGNVATAYTNATVFAANASNINTGTLAEARLPYRMDQNVRTTDNIILGNLTLTGNLTVGSNVNVIGANNLSVIDNMIYLNANNTVANPDLGFAGNYNDGTYHHAGFFRDASDGYWKVFDNYSPEPDANAYIDTTNTSFHLANFQANSIAVGNTSVNWIVANDSGVYASSTLIGNSTGPYGKTEGTLNVNSAVTSNNSTYAYGKSEAGLNVNSALTSNNSTYAYGKSEAGLNVNSALTSNNSTYANSSSTNTFTIGSSVYFVANGNVGVGTSSPLSKFHIHQANGIPSTSARFFANTSTKAQFHISSNTNGSTGSNTFQYGISYDINGATQAAILISENGTDGTAIAFYDTNSYAIGPQLRAYFDSTGMFLPGASNTYDLGSSSLRWRNIYTNDLNLSNGIGDYTVVEGEEDLFLYNNKSGKVFKFALIEVDPSVAPPKKE